MAPDTQVAGRRQVALYPPQAGAALYGGEAEDGHSPFEPLRPDYVTFPAARCAPARALLAANSLAGLITTRPSNQWRRPRPLLLLCCCIVCHAVPLLACKKYCIASLVKRRTTCNARLPLAPAADHPAPGRLHVASPLPRATHLLHRCAVRRRCTPRCCCPATCSSCRAAGTPSRRGAMIAASHSHQPIIVLLLRV